MQYRGTDTNVLYSSGEFFYTKKFNSRLPFCLLLHYLLLGDNSLHASLYFTN